MELKNRVKEICAAAGPCRVTKMRSLRDDAVSHAHHLNEEEGVAFREQFDIVIADTEPMFPDVAKDLKVMKVQIKDSTLCH